MHRPRFRPRVAAALMSFVVTPAVAQTATSSLPASPARQTAPPVPPAANDADGSAVERIVVTANKRREQQRDVANSVTAISGKELDRKQEVSLQDLISHVPGLSLAVSDKTNVRIVLRGLNAGGAGATVGSVLDDVGLNSTGAQGDYSRNSSNFDTYDLNRIEVLRGPQSTLYGATAEGGLVKYVSNAPNVTHYAGELETGVAGNTDGSVGGSTKGFVNVPFWNGKAAVRFTAWNSFIPGYIDNPAMGRTNTDTGQRYGWRASLLVQPIPDLTIRLTAQRQTLFSDAADVVQVAGAALTPINPPANQLSLIDGLTNNTTLPTNSQNETGVYYANVDYDMHWATLTSITSYSYNNFKTLFDATNTNLAPGLDYGDYLGTNVYGVGHAPIGERQNSNADKFAQEVRLASEPGLAVFGRNLDWIGGAFYTRENSAFLQGLDAFTANSPYKTLSPALGATHLVASLSEWAVFGQFDYHLWRSFDVAIGGRFSGTAQHSQTTDTCCVLNGTGAILPEITSNDHDALYSIAPRWRPTDDTMFYARLATGYRPGGPNLETPGLTGLPSYQPDHTVNYEIGWRQDLFDRKVSIDLTGYYINWRNIQVLSEISTASGVVGANGNAGGAVSKGVEWTLNWVPLRGLKISTTGDYTDTRLTKDAVGLGGASGDFLPYVPNIVTSVDVEYSWNAFRDYSAYVSGDWSFTGERFTDFAPAGGATSSHAELPSYSTGAIRAGLENRRYSLEAFIINLSDERGITFYTNQGGANQTGQASIIQPRTVGLTARVKF